ncbi:MULTISPECIES: OsmC family protein [Kitasatospora]|uniref:OsmC family protein n=1 Tax=Kitasatospora cathayae TaxID=3004092 RepID=A0ABY7QH36_9ACTN|nr:OsmC family protein [Kitasatospora sp. HUAS 3-15]WBP91431.1 OsmC family protein [Kitasatospora sp. HUAS 3-15]
MPSHEGSRHSLAAAFERPHALRPGRIDVDPVAGDLYAVDIRSHALVVDQPVRAGGSDAAPTPVELCASALASCTAHYAGSYLDRHRLSRDGLHVTADLVGILTVDDPLRDVFQRLFDLLVPVSHSALRETAT